MQISCQVMYQIGMCKRLISKKLLTPSKSGWESGSSYLHQRHIIHVDNQYWLQFIILICRFLQDGFFIIIIPLYIRKRAKVTQTVF